MPVKVLFYREDTPFGDSAFLGKFAMSFGVDTIIIDTSGDWPKRSKAKGLFYSSFREALADPLYQDYTWVWLDHRGTEYLEDFEHPEDNVVYCIGHDIHGFEEIGDEVFNLPGHVLGLRVAQGAQWFASVCLGVVVYDRYLRLE